MHVFAASPAYIMESTKGGGRRPPPLYGSLHGYGFVYLGRPARFSAFIELLLSNGDASFCLWVFPWVEALNRLSFCPWVSPWV